MSTRDTPVWDEGDRWIRWICVDSNTGELATRGIHVRQMPYKYGCPCRVFHCFGVDSNVSPFGELDGREVRGITRSPHCPGAVQVGILSGTFQEARRAPARRAVGIPSYMQGAQCSAAP